MKAFIAFVVLLLLVLGSGVGWYGLQKWNKIEPYGVSFELPNTIPEEEWERVTASYNAVLDSEAVLRPAFEQHDLANYYKDSSREEAFAKFSEDTYVDVPYGTAIHVLYRGPRKSRKVRQAAAETLAESFMRELQSRS